MDIGHFGVGLALKKTDTGDSVNLGILTLAGLFLDLLYYIFLITGIEGMLTGSENLLSALPYSHGVLASIVWSAAAFMMVWLWKREQWKKPLQSALIVAAAVFSHFILDAIYYTLGLPSGILTAIQWILVVAGLWLYINTVKQKTQVSAWKLILPAAIPVIVLSIPTILLLFAGPVSTATLPDPGLIGVFGIFQILVCAAVAFWIDHNVRKPGSNGGA